MCAQHSERTATIGVWRSSVRNGRANAPQCSCAERLGRGSVRVSALGGIVRPVPPVQSVMAVSGRREQGNVSMGDPTSPAGRWTPQRPIGVLAAPQVPPEATLGTCEMSLSHRRAQRLPLAPPPRRNSVGGRLSPLAFRPASNVMCLLITKLSRTNEETSGKLGHVTHRQNQAAPLLPACLAAAGDCDAAPSSRGSSAASRRLSASPAASSCW